MTLCTLLVFLGILCVRGSVPTCPTLGGRPLLLSLPSWGVVSVRGEDRLRLMHGLASQSFENCQINQAFSTCLLDAAGKVVHYARALITPTDIKLVGEESDKLLAYLDRFIFPADRVTVVDESRFSRICLTVGGSNVVRELGLLPTAHQPQPQQQEQGEDSVHSDRQLFETLPTDSSDSGTCTVIPGNDLSAPGSSSELCGHTILYQSTVSPPLPRLPPHVTLGDEATWHALRLQTGRFSLLRDALPHNATALELGLMHTLHFQKGCYVGNEVVSKAVATKAVRRRLVGVEISGGTGSLAAFDSIVDGAGDEVGVVTSAGASSALALLKAKLMDGQNSAATPLSVEGKPHLSVRARALSYPRFQTSASIAPPLERLKSSGQTIILPTGTTADADAEAARKAAKLEEMARKVAALKARKGA